MRSRAVALPAVPTRGAQVGDGEHGLAPVLLVVLGAALVVPYAAVGAAPGAARALVPLYVFLVGAWLAKHRLPLYPAFCASVFAFAPFLRRVADLHAGFVPINPILLAPYAALLPSLPSLLDYALLSGRRHAWPFAVMLLCIGWATFLGLYAGETTVALFEAVRWIEPVAICALLLQHPRLRRAARRCFVLALSVLVPVIALYGVFQYFVPQPWDVSWMQNVDNATFGRPVPYEVRVFSTLNSPGSLGMYLGTAAAILVGDGGYAALAALCVAPALALAVIRVGWLACALGCATVMTLGPASRRAALLVTLGAGALAGAMLLGSAELSPQVGDMLRARMESFTDLSNDASANDRLSEYGEAARRIAATPWGEGFGVGSGAAGGANATVGKEVATIDSGIMQALIVFGIVGGTGYLIALAALLAYGYGACRAARGVPAGLLGAFFAVLGTMPLGSDQVGESGILAWIALGLLLTEESTTGNRPRQRPGSRF